MEHTRLLEKLKVNSCIPTRGLYNGVSERHYNKTLLC